MAYVDFSGSQLITLFAAGSLEVPSAPLCAGAADQGNTFAGRGTTADRATASVSVDKYVAAEDATGPACPGTQDIGLAAVQPEAMATVVPQVVAIGKKRRTDLFALPEAAELDGWVDGITAIANYLSYLRRTHHRLECSRTRTDSGRHEQ